MTALTCSLCGCTGPQVAVVFDHGREGVPMCSTVLAGEADRCADRARENEQITKERQ